MKGVKKLKEAALLHLQYVTVKSVLVDGVITPLIGIESQSLRFSNNGLTGTGIGNLHTKAGQVLYASKQVNRHDIKTNQIILVNAETEIQQPFELRDAFSNLLTGLDDEGRKFFASKDFKENAMQIAVAISQEEHAISDEAVKATWKAVPTKKEKDTSN